MALDWILKDEISPVEKKSFRQRKSQKQSKTLIETQETLYRPAGKQIKYT